MKISVLHVHLQLLQIFVLYFLLSDVLYVAMEYLPHGDLRSYLRTARSQSDSDEDALSSSQLVSFALDVAKGMEHLSKSGVCPRICNLFYYIFMSNVIALLPDTVPKPENVDQKGPDF